MSDEGYDVRRSSISYLFDRDRTYQVPPYQRSYSWDSDNAERLFKDLVGTSESSAGSLDYSNLLGAMVVIPEGQGSPKFEVVDGQQRLATTALVLCAIRSHLHKFSSTDLPGTRPALKNALKTIDNMLTVSSGEPRIELGKDDCELFRDILSTKTHDYETRCKELLDKYTNGKKRILGSNSQLIKNYKALSKLVEEWIPRFNLDSMFANKRPDDFSEAVHELTSYVTQNIVKSSHFAFIVVHDKNMAYKIFATFNSAGQKLLQADLIKSHLLGKADSEKNKDRLESLWRAIFDGRLKDHDRFLYESTSSRHPSGRCHSIPITTENLYRIVESMVKNAEAAEGYIRRLSEDAKIVKLMDHPDDLPEADKYDKTRNVFNLMHLLGAKYIRVPLLAAGRKWKRLDSDEFQTLADCLLTFFFKFKFINDGTAEDVRSIANKVTTKLDENADLSDMIYLILINKDVRGQPIERIKEDDFKKHFQDKMFKLTPNAAKYVLLSMETYLKRANPHPYPKPNSELEHILPKNHQKWEWSESAFLGKKPNDTDIDKYKNRLGNLTLLSAKWNQRMSAKRFENKLNEQEGYKNSDMELNKQYLNHYDDWTADHLEERETRLCELALETWSLKQYDKYLQQHGYRK